jgi:hypothetical protein
VYPARVRKWHIALVLLSCAAILLITMSLARPENEPIYMGRALSTWLMVARDHTDDPAAAAAVDHIGTKALPFLVKWMRYQESAWRIMLRTHTPKGLQNIVWPMTPRGRPDLLSVHSWTALRQLGPRAAAAVPELTALLRNTNAPLLVYRATFALSCLGSNGVASLVGLVHDRGNPLRPMAVMALCKSPPDPGTKSTIGAALLQCLLTDCGDPRIMSMAAGWLSENQYAPEVSVPAIAASLIATNSSESLRFHAIGTLAAYASQATEALLVLTNALADPSPRVRDAATNAIRQITLAPRPGPLAPY